MADTKDINNLADKVIEANESELESSVSNNGYPEEFDEYGIKIYDNAEYYVARALRINFLSRINDNAPLLHTRRNRSELWLGHKRLSLTTDTIYSLTDANSRIEQWQMNKIWKLLLEYAPALDESKILIDNHTYWDIETGEMCHTDDYLEGID